jgi:hypothetical protein
MAILLRTLQISHVDPSNLEKIKIFRKAKGWQPISPKILHTGEVRPFLDSLTLIIS